MIPQLCCLSSVQHLASPGQGESYDPGRPGDVHGPAPDQTSSGDLSQVLYAALHPG